MPMIRGLLTTVALLLSSSVQAAVLQRLTVDDMIAQSSNIVRARVIGSSASFRGAPDRGGMIYTHYTLTVIERMKGPTAASLDVAVPGGTTQGLRQSFAGTPTLNIGQEYVFFLWTSRSGLTQVIGLTQGLFNVHVDAAGNLLATRAASSEVLLDPSSGQAVQDSEIRLNLASLTRQVRTSAPQGAR